MKKITFILFSFLFILLFGGCIKNPKCELPLNVNQSAISIIFKDSVSGKYLYTEDNSLYNKDSIKYLTHKAIHYSFFLGKINWMVLQLPSGS